MTPRFKEIIPETLTSEVFRLYGEVVRKPDTAPQLVVGDVQSWPVPFEADSPAQIMFNRFHRGTGDFSLLERHAQVTQCFFPLGGIGFIMVVAAPTPDARLPDPGLVRAFIVEGAQGLLLWKGTWHSIARFPLCAPHVDICFITDVETQTELESCKATGKRPQLTHYADFQASHGLAFRIAGYGA